MEYCWRAGPGSFFGLLLRVESGGAWCSASDRGNGDALFKAAATRQMGGKCFGLVGGSKFDLEELAGPHRRHAVEAEMVQRLADAQSGWIVHDRLEHHADPGEPGSVR